VLEVAANADAAYQATTPALAVARDQRLADVTLVD